MTREELKREAKEYADKYGKSNFDLWDTARFAYYQSAEPREKRIAELAKENAELRAIAENLQSSNMSRYFENKKLKEGLTVGSMWNKHLNSQNKALEEERDRYRNMTFDQREQLTKAKVFIRNLKSLIEDVCDINYLSKASTKLLVEAEQFLNSEEEK